MFTIGDTAKLTQLSPKQLRDYEVLGLVVPIARTPAGYRLYNDDNIMTLQFISHARKVGFSLAQIEVLLHLKNNPNRRSCEVKQLVAHHIDELTCKINELTQMRATLQSWHEACAGDDGAGCAILQALA